MFKQPNSGSLPSYPIGDLYVQDPHGPDEFAREIALIFTVLINRP